MFPEEIQTERLRFVRLSRETVATTDLYRHMCVDAPHMDEISEYVMWDPHETVKDTHEYLTDVEQQWNDREQATYAIFLRESEAEKMREAERSEAERTETGVEDDPLVGTTNLNFHWDQRSAELGIWLRKPFWGRGYSGERAGALLELAFERLDLELVGASHQDGNEKSRRAIEKYVERFGGQYDGVLRNFVPSDDEVRNLHRHTILADQYREAVADDESVE